MSRNRNQGTGAAGEGRIASPEVPPRIPGELDLGEAFRGLADNSPALVWIKDLAGRYVYVNDEAVQAFGWDRERILGRTDAELFPEEIARQFSANDQLALLAGPGGIRVEETLEQADGFVHTSKVSKFALFDADGNPSHVGGTAFDVTQQRQAELQLDAVLASIGDHLVTYDRQWRFTYVNDAAAAALRRPADELLGRCIWDLFPEAVGNQYYREVHEALEKQTIIRSEHYYEPFDQWFENHIYPRADGVTVFSADITIRKRMQAELDRRAEEAATANRRKDEFLAMLGHELRNPLAPLAASLQLLDLAKGDVEAFERTRSIMERQVQQMARLIDDLVDVSRITRGRIELRREPMDLRDALRRAVEGTAGLMEMRGHRLELDIAADPVRVEGDASRLSQVFTNLLNNAAKYTPTGGHVRAGVAVQGRSAIGFVEDNGPGIPPDRVDEVFELFVQLEGDPRGVQQGLGVGLTLVQRLVQKHGGTVRIENLDPGARFVVELPLCEADLRESAMPGLPREGWPGPPLRILVVDDNLDAAKSLELLLVSAGHIVRTSHDGTEALTVAEQFRPDAALLDLGLPGQTGLELAKAFRASEWGRRVLLVAVTGWALPENRKASQQAGFDHHLTKPLDWAHLESILLSSTTGAEDARG